MARVVKRSFVAVVAVCLVGALAVPGCGTTDTEPADTESVVSADPTPEPTASPEPTAVPPEPEPDLGWMHAFTDVAVTDDGVVYASAGSGIATLDEAGEWVIVDTAGLPEGQGAAGFMPGRMINHVATGPGGELWVTGWAQSTLDDKEFGGTVSGWSDARDLSWIARQDCLVDGCSWEVFTSDDTPELMISYRQESWPADIGDIAIGSHGTLYASVGDSQLAVYDGSGWEAHTVPDLSDRDEGYVSPWSSSLAVGTDGLLWAGTNDPGTGRGLFVFDGVDFTHLTTADGLPSDNAFQVAAGGDGTIWVATDVLYANPATASPDEAAGIASYDGTSWTTYTVADGLLSNDGIVAAGPDGTAWVMHNEIGQHGYARFDGSGWMAFPTDPPVGDFRAVVDPEGTLWTATEAGLVSFDGTTKTIYESPFASNEQAAFSFADDDMCEWVSEEEVADFVAAEFDWDGYAVVATHPYEEAACQWTLTTDPPVADVRADSPLVIASDAGQWVDFDGNPYDPGQAEVVEYDEGTVDIGASVIGHPALSDGVVVHNGGFGQFAFGVPPDSEWLALTVEVRHGGDHLEWEDFEPRFFAVADHFVHELGWLADR